MARFSTTPFLALDALYEGGRMFVGAVSTAYLLSRGLSLADVATIKSWQALVFLFAELPTGLLADSRGHRWSLTCSLVSAILGLGLYALGSNLVHFLLAETLTALSLCFWSGAFEAFSIEGAGLEGERSKLDRFFHMNQAVDQTAVLVCGFLGGWLASERMDAPYWAAIVAIAVALILVNRLKGRELPTAPRKRTTMLEQLKTSFGVARAVPSLGWILAASVLVQALVQPLLHFWQPFFQDQGFSEKTLGVIFASYCAAGVLVGFAMARLSKHESCRTPAFTKVLFALAALSFVGMSATHGLVSIVLFCSTQALLTAARTSLGARLNEKLVGATRASILSMNAMISRLGMVASLSVISIVSKNGTTSMMQLYAVASLVCVAALSLVFARAPKAVRA